MALPWAVPLPRGQLLGTLTRLEGEKDERQRAFDLVSPKPPRLSSSTPDVASPGTPLAGMVVEINTTQEVADTGAARGGQG